eukprot:707183_1
MMDISASYFTGQDASQSSLVPQQPCQLQLPFTSLQPPFQTSGCANGFLPNPSLIPPLSTLHELPPPPPLLPRGPVDRSIRRKRPGGQRKLTSIACLSCYKAKTGCDQMRPCSRCVRLGRTAYCVDRPRKPPACRKPKNEVEAEKQTKKEVSEGGSKTGVNENVRSASAQKVEIPTTIVSIPGVVRERSVGEINIFEDTDGVPLACLPCKQAKVWCDKSYPCERCQRMCRTCEMQPGRSVKRRKMAARVNGIRSNDSQTFCSGIPRPRTSTYALFGMEATPPPKLEELPEIQFAPRLQEDALVSDFAAMTVHNLQKSTTFSRSMDTLSKSIVAHFIARQAESAVESQAILGYMQKHCGVEVSRELVPPVRYRYVSRCPDPDGQADSEGDDGMNIADLPCGVMKTTFEFDSTKSGTAFIEMNDSICTIFGRPPMDIVSNIRSNYQFYHSKDWPQLLEKIVDIVAGRCREYSCVSHCLRPNGQVVRCVQTYRLVCDANGLPRHGLLCLMPIPS